MQTSMNDHNKEEGVIRQIHNDTKLLERSVKRNQVMEMQLLYNTIKVYCIRGSILVSNNYTKDRIFLFVVQYFEHSHYQVSS